MGDLAYTKALLAGRGYDLGDKLSEGSFAVVRSAMSQVDNVEVAVKMVDRTKAPKDFLDKFFPKEIDIMKTLRHENVIHAWNVVHAGWYTCIIMEKAVGDLLGYITNKGALSESEARPMLREMLSGLSYMHGLNIAHRDLKCENVLIDKDNRCKLGDFGFARYVVDPKTKMRELSETFCGSAAYAAPEILQVNTIFHIKIVFVFHFSLAFLAQMFLLINTI